MNKEQIHLNNISAYNNNVQEFKECCGKDCRNPGTHCLTIIYLNKSGYFCTDCKIQLENDGLVFHANITNKNKGEGAL